MKPSFKLLSSLMIMGAVSSCFADTYQEGQNALNNHNYDKALQYFTQSCDNGDSKGCFSLGNMYEKGEGVGQNKYQAVALYTQACRAGNPLGCSNMALSYDTP